MREKLIELLYEAENKCSYADCGQCEHLGLDACGFRMIADHLIANGVTFGKDINVPSWIPVSERLPEVYKLVLAVCKNGKIFVGEYVDLGWRTLWRIKTARDSTKEITRIVTHWMPLPDPPKENDNGNEKELLR